MLRTNRIIFIVFVIITTTKIALAKDLYWQSQNLSKYFIGEKITKSIPQNIQPEPSTFHSIGVRWPIVGDANANAKILVRYKRSSDTEYFPGLPLYRTLPYKNSPDNRVPNGWLFAGSIFNLEENKEYSIELKLVDPDGGSTTKTINVSTKSELTPPKDMRIKHVYPISHRNNFANKREETTLFGLKEAHAATQPGDLLLLHAGVYQAGEWQITNHGTSHNPIIYKSAGDGEVIFDGQNQNRLVNADRLKNVWFEEITFKNAKYLMVAHNGSDIVLRKNKFLVQHTGFTAINGDYTTSQGFVITDNEFIGTTKWPRSKGIESIKGVEITGSGHVIAHNYFSNLGDAIHGSQHGNLSSSDIYNNDIFISTDDGIETDYSDTNVRVFNNRITNVFAGITAQPVNGGPVYIFRNSIYNTQYSPFKLHNHTSGVIILNNTSATHGIAFDIKNAGEEVSNVLTRNNLFIGAKDYGLHSVGKMLVCDFDNDGYGGFSGMFGWDFALWNGKNYPKTKHTLGSNQLYSNIGAIVINPKVVFSAGKLRPSTYTKTFDTNKNNFTLAEKSSAIDTGVLLPTITDNYTGKAPDLGCCEYGKQLPRYGPRHHF